MCAMRLNVDGKYNSNIVYAGMYIGMFVHCVVSQCMYIDAHKRFNIIIRLYSSIHYFYTRSFIIRSLMCISS